MTHFVAKLALIVSVVTFVSGCQPDTATPSQPATNPLTASQLTMAANAIESAHRGQRDDRAAAAFDANRQRLIAEPDNFEALKNGADYLATQGRYREAAAIAVELSKGDVPDPINALLHAYQWHLRAAEIEAAEDDLRMAIAHAPHDVRGHRSIAQLLSSQGRRFEAREHLLELARQSTINHRELLGLIDLSSPLELVTFAGLVDESDGNLFDLGKARYLYFQERKREDALRIVNELSQRLGPRPATEALRGRWIAENGHSDAEFLAWLHRRPHASERFPEYWLAIGLWLSRNERDREAVRALGEALRLDPGDRGSLRAMSASLSRLGERNKALHTQRTLATLDKLVRIATDADMEQSFWIAEQLQSLSRPWESISWYRHALQRQGTLHRHVAELHRRLSQIRQWEAGVTQDQIRDWQLASAVGFDIRQFPSPQLEATAIETECVESEFAGQDLRFRDVAKAHGIEANLVSGYPLDSDEFFLYQANGGGLAVLDYDLDGRCDLYLVQSGGDPNEPASSAPNQLFRCLPGEAFEEVAGRTLTADTNFGQGACAGDLNQDGFPDLLVANIGHNTVYINQGDGTFRERPEMIREQTNKWSSSIAMGDLDGDQLPDIIEVNYLDDPLIFQQTCTGRQRACAPQKFRAASDRFYRSVGDGTFQRWSDALDHDSLPNYGFGVVIADVDGHDGNDVFISNDGDLNHFWKSSASEESAQRYRLTEQAGLSGCSVGASGDWEACMGIATGDFDRNGLHDLLVTNFYNEPVNLFLQNESGFFVDEALQYGLARLSCKSLGFGTQAADFDNDGWLDLAILNGHLYDARYGGVPFQMVSQLLRGSPRGFVLQDAQTAGPYWDRPQLARTLALVDFNRDGRMDLVANHLDQPLALLQNDSATHAWLQLVLVGVASDRTAIGAKIVVHGAGQRWTAWQTGGDGYMCTNEDVIHFGIGEAAMIDRIEITWPSGVVQKLGPLSTNNRYLVVEGDDQPWKMISGR